MCFAPSGLVFFLFHLRRALPYADGLRPFRAGYSNNVSISHDPFSPEGA